MTVVPMQQEEQAQNSGMDKMRVTGGCKLNGEIKISGAKNAALKHMCASILTDEPFILENMPTTLRDVKFLTQVLEQLGVKVTLDHDKKIASLGAKDMTSHVAPYDLVRKMRASILVLGPLLARLGQADTRVHFSMLVLKRLRLLTVIPLLLKWPVLGRRSMARDL